MKTPAPEPVIPEVIPLDTRIFTVRGQQVMLDMDLAKVYEVSTSHLNQSVTRNEYRFPSAFSFQLEQNEWDILRSQIVISNIGRGGRRYPPRVFTEHGAVMLASVLNSERAIQASIAVVNAFVRLHRVLDANRALARKVEELSEKVDLHDKTIAVIFHELQRLVAGDAEPEPEKPKGRIGYRIPGENAALQGQKRLKGRVIGRKSGDLARKKGNRT